MKHENLKFTILEMLKAKMNQPYRNRNLASISSGTLQSEDQTIPNTPKTPGVASEPILYDVPLTTVTSKL